MSALSSEIIGVIDPNGAGKAAVFNVVTKLFLPDEGSVRFAGITPTVEHKVRQAPQIADGTYVLQTGKITLEERVAELLRNDEVSNALRGGEVEWAANGDRAAPATRRLTHNSRG